MAGMLVHNAAVVFRTALVVMSLTEYLPPDEKQFKIDTVTLENGSKCYGKYGCFGVEEPWTSDVRPISYVPESPESISPKFCLFTRTNPTACYPLVDGKIKDNIYLKPHNRVVMISHGFLENGTMPWMTNMVAELLRREDLNVVTVDWGGGSRPPYSQAVANIRIVGAVAAHVLYSLTKLNVDMRNVHVVGHSLGAHLASYVGETLKANFGLKLGRITGLDPAEPHFTKTPPPVRLDPSDAHFVDVIHTDAAPFIKGGLGLLEPVGHVDFYPNGGVTQPGCGDGVMGHIDRHQGSLFRGIQSFLGCNHVRSYQLFTESINSRCSFRAVQCTGWEAFERGACFSCSTPGAFCTSMGYHARPHRVSGSNGVIHLKRNLSLYLMTGADSPYCHEHYRVTLNISASMKSVKHGGEVGVFWMTLKGPANTTHRVRLNAREQLFEPGTVHQMVVSAPYLDFVEGVALDWAYHTSVLNPLTWRILTPPRLYLSSVRVDILEKGSSLTLCHPDGKPIYSGEVIKMQGGHCEMKKRA